MCRVLCPFVLGKVPRKVSFKIAFFGPLVPWKASGSETVQSPWRPATVTVKCCFEHVWTSKLSKSNSWIRQNCFPFGAFAPAPHLESSLRSRVLLRRRRCEAWATMPSGNFTNFHTGSGFFGWFCICFPSRSDTVPWYRPSRFHNGGLHPRRPCPGSLAWISIENTENIPATGEMLPGDKYLGCCMMFLWSSCLSIAKCCAFSWKSVISRFPRRESTSSRRQLHDLFEAPQWHGDEEAEWPWTAVRMTAVRINLHSFCECHSHLLSQVAPSQQWRWKKARHKTPTGHEDVVTVVWLVFWLHPTSNCI